MTEVPADGSAPERATLVIGVGNRHRRDDAVGLDTADRVSPRLAGHARVVLFDGESTDLLDLWTGAGLVVLVDALPPRGEPGRVRRFEGDLTALISKSPASSTHGLSVGEVWRLGATLGQLPDRIVVFGVEGAEFTPGVGLSPAVARAIDPVAEAIISEVLGGPTHGATPRPEEARDA
ncbi:MAG: hydrogenase maturation protease [Thermoplasmata archaeon]